MGIRFSQDCLLYMLSNVFVYVCIFVCMCKWVSVYTCVWVRECVHVRAWVYASVHVWVCEHVHGHDWTCAWVCVCVCACMCVNVYDECVWVCACAWLNVRAHMCMYSCKSKNERVSACVFYLHRVWIYCIYVDLVLESLFSVPLVCMSEFIQYLYHCGFCCPVECITISYCNWLQLLLFFSSQECF